MKKSKLLNEKPPQIAKFEDVLKRRHIFNPPLLAQSALFPISLSRPKRANFRRLWHSKRSMSWPTTPTNIAIQMDNQASITTGSASSVSGACCLVNLSRYGTIPPYIVFFGQLCLSRKFARREQTYGAL